MAKQDLAAVAERLPTLLLKMRNAATDNASPSVQVDALRYGCDTLTMLADVLGRAESELATVARAIARSLVTPDQTAFFAAEIEVLTKLGLPPEEITRAQEALQVLSEDGELRELEIDEGQVLALLKSVRDATCQAAAFTGDKAWALKKETMATYADATLDVCLIGETCSRCPPPFQRDR